MINKIYKVIYSVLVFFKFIKPLSLPASSSPSPPKTAALESLKLKLALAKTLVSTEEEILKVQLSDYEKEKVVSQLITNIPSSLSEALKKNRKEFSICYADLHGIHVHRNAHHDDERLFKEIFPLLVQKLRELDVPFREGSNIVFFNVKEIKKFTNYEKNKNFI